MPEFIPEHTPDVRHVKPAELADMLKGYLECAEWLVSDINGEEPNLTACRGWHRSAIKEAREDCAAFLKANGALLAEYEAESGRDMESAGHDFYLSREGHGAGFFDRGNAPCFDALQEAARGFGSTGGSCYWRRYLRFESGASMTRRPDAWAVVWKESGRPVLDAADKPREYRTKREAANHARLCQPRGSARAVPRFDGKRNWEA